MRISDWSSDVCSSDLAAAPGEAWLVLGDMRELGDDAQSLHEQAGRRAKEAGIARLYALGALSAAGADAFGEGGRKFDTHEALAEALRADIAAFLGRSEEHTSELQALMRTSYAVFCLK